ncbi:hypothetical protein B0H14DRAFT_2982904 [Mycena olivaceomarginata]|nr:hypothetical protein B0H14DRAFT_2982904 [Mycena olivaceomarginata]
MYRTCCALGARTNAEEELHQTKCGPRECALDGSGRGVGDVTASVAPGDDGQEPGELKRTYTPSIHIGLAEVDPGIAQIGCTLPVESGFAQFREKEGGGVDPGMRVEATATDEQEDGWDGMQGSEALADDFLSPHLSHYPSIYMTIISPTHTRVDDVSPPHPYILPTPGLFKKDWEMDILKRALQGGREHDFSGRSLGPYDGPQQRNNGGLD